MSGAEVAYWRLRPRAPAPGTALGPIGEIPERSGREYVFGRGKSAFSMFVVRRGGSVRGYLNLCPHFSLPLNHRAGEFMNDDASRIRCSMHFAEFRFEDGVCLAGAAEGGVLDAIPLVVGADGIVSIQPD
jgi:nitrite reductase/ring-hydroxylating ferredoxin subunit